MDDRHVAVILEQIQSNFKAFGEGLAALREKLDETKRELRQELRESKEEFRQTKEEFRQTKEELTRLMQGVLTILDRHDISIEDLEKRVARLEKRAG